MAYKHFCDICNKEIDYDNRMQVGRSLVGLKDYCLDCWQIKKNWSKIHEFEDKGIALSKTSSSK